MHATWRRQLSSTVRQLLLKKKYLMRTVTDNLKEMAEEIQVLLEDFLLHHSSIYMWNTPDSSILALSGNYAYKELQEEGRQIQTQLLEEYRHFYALLAALLKEQTKDTLKELKKADKSLMSTIEHDQTWCKNTQEALDKAIEALQTELRLLSRLYDSSDGEATYVPDTNSLLYNPDLESWIFSDTSKFIIVLLPTVLSELDLLKVNHRNEEVRMKVEHLIRRIKEYRRRGKLISGVTLIKDKIKIQAIAVEPDMESSLPWLDSDNNDDRILAGIVEVMRARPRSPVLAVSRDINFQNKAEFAKIPFEEPPEPI
jgi:hypothetical protein